MDGAVDSGMVVVSVSIGRHKGRRKSWNEWTNESQHELGIAQQAEQRYHCLRTEDFD